VAPALDTVLVEEDISSDQADRGELPEEDDDNPYQNSDEALPEDEEERAISNDPGREGTRFDEVVERER